MTDPWFAPNVRPGQYPDGYDFERQNDQMEALTAAGWTAYTPTWTGSGGNPAIGNGTLTGRYRLVPGGDLVQATIRIQAGSTTTFGTGFWSVGYPTGIPPSATSLLELVVPAITIDASAGNRFNVTGQDFVGALVFNYHTSSIVGPTVPFTWTTSDMLTANFCYEPA